MSIPALVPTPVPCRGADEALASRTRRLERFIVFPAVTDPDLETEEPGRGVVVPGVGVMRDF